MIKFKNVGKDPLSELPPKPIDTKNPDPSPEPLYKIKDFPNNHVMYHLHKQVACSRGARAHNVVHASDLDPVRRWCPREPALLTKYTFKRPSGFISTAQGTVFKFGHKAADIVIESLPPEIVWGNWKCLACGHDQKHQFTPPSCQKCNANRKALSYREVFMRDPATGIVGSCDVWVDLLKNGQKTMIEIKSEGNTSFKNRSKAEFDHDWRTKLYLWLAERTPWLTEHNLNLHEARVLYVTKEGHIDTDLVKKWGLSDWSKTPFKEYFVERDDTFSQNQRDLVMTYRKWRNAFEAHGQHHAVPLPTRVCKTKNDTKARDCSVCKQCFDGGVKK